MLQIDPWLSLGVFLSTAATDAVYVMFNAAVSAKRRIPAATWSSVWSVSMTVLGRSSKIVHPLGSGQ